MVRISKILFNIWVPSMLIIMVSRIVRTIILYREDKDYFHRGDSCLLRYALFYTSVEVFVSLTLLLGIIGSICRVKILKTFYKCISGLILTFVVFIMLFSIFAIPKADPSASWQNVYMKNVPWTKEYSGFLRAVVVSSKVWPRVEKCLKNHQLCEKFHQHDNKSSKHMSDLLVQGCCSPPGRCGLKRTNGNESHWEGMIAKAAENDEECIAWTTNSKGNCYECNMCKASYIADFLVDFSYVCFFYYLLGVFFAVSSILIIIGAFREPDRR